MSHMIHCLKKIFNITFDVLIAFMYAFDSMKLLS